LAALAQCRLPELGGIAVALLLVGGRPDTSAPIAPLSTVTASIIARVIAAGVTIARVTSAGAAVALGTSAALVSAAAPAAALAAVVIAAARITSTAATRPNPAAVPTTATALPAAVSTVAFDS
jgi:hypothetical protein